MKNQAPIKIYLDTSDYSALYLRSITDANKEVLEYLKEKILEGTIIIGFSYPIVWEFLQDYSLNNKTDRLNRAKIIKELCRNISYKYFSEVSLKSPISYEGKWFPDSENDFSVDSLKTTIIKNNALNRAQRRKLENLKNFKNFVIKNPKVCDFNNEDLNNIPITKSFIKEKILYKYFLGEIPKREANKRLWEVFTNLELFVEFWYENLNQKNPFTDFVHEINQEISEEINEIRKAYNELKIIGKKIKEKENQIKQHTEISPGVKKELLEGFKKLRIQKSLMENDEYIPALGKENLEDMNLDNKDFEAAYVEGLLVYLKGTAKTNLKLQNSDLADILHASYLPYSDLWRGDKKFSNMLIKHQISGYEKIVPKLVELPKRIEKLLS